MNDQPYMLYLPVFGRFLLVSAFLISGFGKIAAPAATIAYIGSTGAPLPVAGYAIAIIIELGGGLLLLFGYKTRAVAAVMALFCVVTALIFHHAFSDQNQMIHFLKNISMAGGFLQVAAFGAGPVSLDARAKSAG